MTASSLTLFFCAQNSRRFLKKCQGLLCLAEVERNVVNAIVEFRISNNLRLNRAKMDVSLFPV
jgi:hypothetical protein